MAKIVSFTGAMTWQIVSNFSIPTHLSQYLGLLPVYAGKVGVTHLHGVPVSPSCLITPRLRVLPMGFSFALHWAQQAHLTILKRAGVVSPERVVVDFRPPPEVGPDSVSTVIYVDNGVFMGKDRSTVEDVRSRAQAALEAKGLPIHDIVIGAREMETLGLRFHQHGVSSTPARRWKLKRAIDYVLQHGRITGEELEKLIGHLSFCLLIRRPTLCVFRTC